jgi:hypothetical protein
MSAPVRGSAMLRTEGVQERRGETVPASASTVPHVLEGLMQHDVPLALDHVLRRMRTVVGRGTVVTAGPDGARIRAT